MKIPVTDNSVNEFASQLRAGNKVTAVFPAKMSDCDFTESQREIIRKARTDRKAILKKSNPTLPVSTENQPNPKPSLSPLTSPKSKALTKLRKMLYLQSNRCFFCGEILKEEDASIEHLNPISRGGSRTEDNEVVCHSTLNQTFGPMDIKRKMEFIIKSVGHISCPKK